jgi:hypothetical protein
MHTDVSHLGGRRRGNQYFWRWKDGGKFRSISREELSSNQVESASTDGKRAPTAHNLGSEG